MALDFLERTLIGIIIGCCFGIVFVLIDKYNFEHSEHQDNLDTYFDRDSIPIIEHRARPKDTEWTNQQWQTKATSSNTDWVYHQKKVEFLNPLIALQSIADSNTYAFSSDNFQNDVAIEKLRDRGVFAVDQIPFGTVLSVEYPIIDIPENDYEQRGFEHFWQRLPYLHRKVQDLIQIDGEFKRVWDTLPINPAAKLRFAIYLRANQRPDSGPDLDDYIRFTTNKFGADSIKPWAVYSIIGRVGFGLPQNAMVVVNAKDKGYKALLIATRDIKKGEEIVLDHFMDWSDPKLLEPDNLYERGVRCSEREFQLNDKWLSFLKQIQDESASMVEKQRMFLELYPNGLIGKDSNSKFRAIGGCTGITKNPMDCHKKVQLTQAIESGAIFDRKHYGNGLGIDGSANVKMHESPGDQCPVDDKACFGLKEDYLSKEHRETVNKHRDAFHYDADSANDRKLMPHPISTKFVHSALKLKYFGEDKQYGLITTKNIPFGSVLVVEYPMLLIGEYQKKQMKEPMANLESKMYHVTKSIEINTKIDKHFNRIWNEEFKANQLTFTSWLYSLLDFNREIPSFQVLLDWAKFNTFWFGGINGYKPIGIYSILSRINYGIPQNMAAIFGDKKDKFVLVLIATRNLEEGEELQIDYLMNLHSKNGNSESAKWARANRGEEFGFKWTPNMSSMVQDLHSDKVSKKKKRKLIFERLYANGIIGRESGGKLKMINGCDWLTETDCKTKKVIKHDTDNGELFRIIRERTSGAEWMGKEFAELSMNWKQKSDKNG